MKFDQLIFVTGNPHKAREVSQILNFPIVNQSIDLPEIQSLDLQEIVQDKARTAYQILGQPLLVEDTSLVFHGLGKLPGPLIKWFLKSMEISEISRLLKDFSDKKATAIACFGLVDQTGQVQLFEGSITGKIADQPLGDNGFGWDPIFIPNGYDLSFAQLGEEKNKISHRYLALTKLKEYLVSHH